MKNITAILLVCAVTGTNSFGDALTQGSKGFSLRGRMHEGAAGREYEGEIALGIMAVDALEVGVMAGYTGHDSANRWHAGMFAEYNFDTGSRFVPFVGVSVAYVSSTVKRSRPVQLPAQAPAGDIAENPDDTSEGEALEDELEPLGDAEDGDANADDDANVDDEPDLEPEPDQEQELSDSIAAEGGENERTRQKQTAAVLTAKAGVKWFVTSHVALEAAVSSSWASEKIYTGKETPQAQETQVFAGLRVYF